MWTKEWSGQPYWGQSWVGFSDESSLNQYEINQWASEECQREEQQVHVGGSTAQCVWELARSLTGGGIDEQSVRGWELARISLERKIGAR